MLRIHKALEVVGKHAYTSEGDYFGMIEEVNLLDNKIDGWKVRVSGGFAGLLGGARGVIIPHQFVKAIGDVLIVNKASLPVRDEGAVVDVNAGQGMSPESSSPALSKF